MKRSAVLITCYNKCEITIRCLSLLYDLIDDSFDVFLVDDGSTDGTSERVSAIFPNVNLITGDGNLFWCRGMSLAWETASKFDYDYYIWLNNDVYLRDFSFENLFSTSKLYQDKVIVSGIIESKDGDIIYGGYDSSKKLIRPNGLSNNITYLNGNFVLVPKFVFKIIGNFDPVFHHDLGDVAYGFSSKFKGIPVVSTKNVVGVGEVNNICRERLNNVNVISRFRRLYSPLGSPPFINFYFRKKYFSLINATLYFLFQHFLNFIPDSVNILLFGKKYV